LSAVLPDQALTLFSAWIDHLPLGLRKDAERRTATLLPCLMLARVDGKSPVEYLDAAEQQRVRDIAMPIVATPPATIGEVVQRVRMAAEAD